MLAKVPLDGLLRGDQGSSYSANAVSRKWRWLSVNDVRRLENLNEIPEGDHYLEPLNMKDAADPSTAPTTGMPPVASPVATRDLTPIIKDALERIH